MKENFGLPLNIESTSFPKNGSHQEISELLHTFAEDHNYRWHIRSTFFPEDQNGHQIFQVNYPGGTAYHLYVDGIIPDVVYVFQGESLIGLHLNKINLEDGVINRDRYVFTPKNINLTRIVQSTTGKTLSQQEFKFSNQ